MQINSEKVQLTESDSFCLVDDNPIDHQVFKRVVKKLEIKGTLHLFDSGEHFLQFMEACKAANTPLPKICFMDINMPGIGGFKATKSLKTDLGLNIIPIVYMFSSSTREEDRKMALEVGALGLITKPAGIKGYMEVLSSYIYS